jgi:PAS domain S-box-containing protein
MEKILLFLNDRDSLAQVRESLEGDYQVVSAAGRADLAEPWDLAILDYPAWAGLQAPLQARKQMAGQVLLPVLLAARPADLSQVDEAGEALVDDLLLLPLEPRELALRVGTLLRARRLSLELLARQEQLEAQAAALEIQNEELRAQKEELERLASFPQLNPNPVLEMDLRGRITYCNEAAVQALARLSRAEAADFLPSDLKEILAAARKNPQTSFYRELSLGDAIFGVYLNIAEPFQVLRLYAMDITEAKQAEAAMRRGKEEWERTFDAVPDLIAILDSEHRVVRCNRAMAAALGMEPPELVGRPCYEVMHRAATPPPFCPHSQLLADGQEHTTEVRESGHDFLVTATPLTDGQGRVLGSVHVARDITERKRAEEALKLSNQSLLLLAETASQLLASVAPQQVADGICQKVMAFLKCDAFFNFLVDEQAGRLHLNACAGIPEEEARRIEWLDYGAAVCGCAAQEGCRIVSTDILAGNDPRTELVKSYGIQAYACHPLMVEGRVLGTLSFGTRSRSFFSDDELALMKAVADQVAIAIDRKRAEEALRESEERYRSLFQNNHSTMLLIDPGTGQIVDANPAAAAYYGYTREELTARKITDLNTLRPEEVFQEMARAASEERRHFEFQHRLASGEIREVEVFSGPILINGRQLLYSIVHDITARKQAEEAIRRQAELLDLAHDAIMVWDLKERIAFWNRGAEEKYGWTKAEVLGKNVHLLRKTEFPKPLKEMEAELLKTGHWEGETVHHTRDGRRLVMACRWALRRDEPGQPARVLEIATDITARKQAEEALQKAYEGLENRVAERTADLRETVAQLQEEVMERQQAEQRAASSGRLYRLLSLVNEAIVRAPDQERLFRQVCRIAVEEGLFRLAWVGLKDPEGKALRPVAQYGFDQGYLDDLAIPLADVPESRGPTGVAVREGRFDICQDFAAEPRMAPWRDQALARGYRSSGAFPLRVGGKVVGALTLYAERPGFFNAEEISLLESLSGDLSFAMESLDREARRRQAEEALVRHTALVHDLYNNAPCGYHSLDRDGTYVQINDTELAWLGYTQEEVLGYLKFSDLLSADSLKIFEENFPGFKERGWVQDLEFELRRKDGSLFPVLLNATVVRDEDGDFLMSRATLFDITERRRSEAALKASEERFVQFMRHLPGAAIMRDAEGRYVFVNETWEELFNLKSAAVLGKTLEESWPPETAARFKALDELVLSEKRALQEVEKFPTSKGDRYLLAARFPILDAAGQPVLLGGIGIDITAHHRAEEALKEQTRYLDAFFEHALTPQVFLDKDFNFIRVNQAYARAGRRSVEEFQGRNHFELYPHEENEAIFRAVVHTRTAYEAVAKAFVYPDHPEWGVTYWDWTLVPILDEAGEVDFLVMSLKDVTARRLAEAALKESEEQLRFLASAILSVQEKERGRLSRELHDGLGQALLVFKLQLRAIQRQLPEECSTLKKDCNFALQYMDEIIEDIRRLSHNLSPTVLEDIGLCAALKNLCQEFERLHNLKVTLGLEELASPLSRQTQIHLYRICQEALANISKHAQASRVSLVMEKQDGELAFIIEDDGAGFDVDEVTAREASGRGLGLAAMIERIRLLGGDLKINSRKGQGTRISFRVPVAPPDWGAELAPPEKPV